MVFSHNAKHVRIGEGIMILMYGNFKEYSCKKAVIMLHLKGKLLIDASKPLRYI